MLAMESSFHGFDLFMIAFTLVSLYGLVRSIRAKNMFAVAFCSVTVLTFLFANAIMALHWFSLLDDVLAKIGVA
jgi:hypothetical protein